MNHFKFLQEIKKSLLTIQRSIDEQNYRLASDQYSALKDELKDKDESYRNNATFPQAITEILHSSFIAKKGTKDHLLISRCIADANSYVNYYIDMSKND